MMRKLSDRAAVQIIIGGAWRHCRVVGCLDRMRQPGASSTVNTAASV
jgi:hypothetical protein